MTNWINFDDQLPDKFPCIARNYDNKYQDVITGIDQNNKAFKHSYFCMSLPSFMSMPFTHWQPLPNPPKEE